MKIIKSANYSSGEYNIIENQYKAVTGGII